MKNKKVADRAVARIAEPIGKPAEMVSVATTHIAALKASPDWKAATGVQTVTIAWEIETANLAVNNKLIADLVKQLDIARANGLTIQRRWDVLRGGVTNAVTVYSDGSKEKVQSFGMGVLERTAAPEATVPQDLLGRRSKQVGTATVVWRPQPGSQGFMVQYAIDPEDPATYSVPLTWSKSRFELTGQTPGTKLYFRVLALDPSLPTGRTDYTSWVEVMVSC